MFCHLYSAFLRALFSKWTRFEAEFFGWCPKLMKIIESTSTSGNSSSMMPTSLRMLGYVFNAYASRSRDSEGPCTARIAARDQESSAKVACFAFWQFRRCVRPYLCRLMPAPAGRPCSASTCNCRPLLPPPGSQFHPPYSRRSSCSSAPARPQHILFKE